MFSNVSPASYNVSETMCTLNFAARCRNVELGSAKKSGSDSAECARLKKLCQRLQDQLAEAGLNADATAGSGAAEDKAAAKKVLSPAKR
mmetsp:Transcript_38895/g.86967  ORF Transcript_38895/g.86967 Transcript_38895/m.86967 type:complete len:89 (+) Transcript_38895:1486-1752(+)